jgi:CHAT domain-containing protein
VGVLSSLPIHAAGVYGRSAEDNISNYMVSSYVPTLTALHRLLFRRASAKSPNSTSPNILLVGEPDAVDYSPLPNAQVEVDVVRNIVAAKAIHPSNHRELSVKAILEGAANAHVIHFACHGHQDQHNPLNSGFDLKDGRLTLGQLMRVSTPHAQLAYLSACESAGMDEGRPDEGLNLVSTMISAGFKSVIGTMWYVKHAVHCINITDMEVSREMDDIDGPFMAQRIYSRIFRDGILDMSVVPYAVDEAVKELRESGVPAYRWATYVHFGV